MALHITVRHIKEILEEENKPLTISQIAARLDLHPQTIRNHMKTAINEGMVSEAPEKDGKALLYVISGVKVSNYPAIQWGDDSREIRELFMEWGKKGLPDNRNAAQIAKLICKLYEYSNEFIYDKDDSSTSYHEKIAAMKELRQRAVRMLKHFREVVAIMNSLIELDIWTPKDVVKKLNLMDEELSPEKINSILGNLDIIQRPANP